MRSVHPRHRLDISWWDLLWGLAACCGTWRRGLFASRVLRACEAEEDGMVCLSVRTGWDLYLQASGMRSGDEILMSAITHPDMARIARGHGLRVVPVDVNLQTLGPRIEALRASLTERTRAVVVAHLFGGRVDLGPVARLAKERGLILIEDCAQAFVGPGSLGHPEADASLYSFGPLKTATALGGAVVRVRDARQLDRMRRIEARYPVRRRIGYAARLVRALFLLCVGDPRVYGALLRVCGRAGYDLDDLLRRMTGSFPTGQTAEVFLQGIRRRPSVPHLALLARRLERFSPDALTYRAAAGERLAAALAPPVEQPGARSVGRTHWLFPVVVPNAEKLVWDLRRRGFDASRATSSIAALRLPNEAPGPMEAVRMMERVVFLPAYAAVPEGERERLASAVNASVVPEIATPRIPS